MGIFQPIDAWDCVSVGRKGDSVDRLLNPKFGLMHTTLEAPPPGIVAAESSAPPPADRPPVSRRTFLSASAIAALVAAAGPLVGQATPALADWGNYQNGRIPVNILAPVPWDTVRILRTDARDALVQLNNAFRPQFGHNITVNDGYRDLAEQVRAKQKYGDKAAEPGTSNHGWAIAVDLADTNRVQLSFNHPIYQWLKTNARQFGYVHPAWAEPGSSRPEPWHWEFNGVYNGTPTTTKMEDSVEAIVRAPNGIVVHLRPGGKTNFGTPQEYNLFRDQIAFLRNAGATDVMALPELSTVPGVTWDTFIYLSRYIGAPE